MFVLDALLIPLLCTIVALTGALVGGILIDAPRPPPSAAGSSTCGRSWTDPMVSTHLWAALPFALALYLRMPLTAGIILVAAAVSIAYHARCESDGSAMLPIADEIAAGAMVAWVVVIFGVSLTLAPHWGLVGACGAILVIALVAYIAGYDNAGAREEDVALSAEEEDARAAFLCMRARLHPLWHLAGFMLVGFVLTNFRREGMRPEMLSTKPWLRAMQTFHY